MKNSKARLSGSCDYRLWTTAELIDGYAFEAGRVDRDDAERTKDLIRKELRRRFEATLKFLDDPQTIEKPMGTLRLLLNDFQSEL